MVTDFFKKLYPGKNDSNQNGKSSLGKSTVIDLDKNKKPPFCFAPFSPKNIIGRDSDINEIVEIARIKNQTRFLIIGDQQFKGIGKTAFSLRVAKKFASQYPDGQVYIDMKPYGRKSLSVTEVMTQILWHFKIQCKIEDYEEKLKETYRKVLAGKKFILVLDGVCEPMEVLKLLPPKICLTIVVSQERISLSGFYRKSMKPLDPQSAQSLLLLHAPKTQEKAKEIVEFCEYIPMIICIAGGLLATSNGISEQSLFNKLQQWSEGNLLMELIDQSYKDLADETSAVLRKISIFPDTFDAKAQDFICQDTNNEHLTALVERQLVMFNEKRESYRLCPTIQNFLRNKITDFEISETSKRHATHFMIRLQGLKNTLEEKDPSSTRASVNAFDLNWGNYQCAQEWALDKLGSTEENNQFCASFPENGAQFLKWHLSPKTCLQWFNSGLSAAKHLGDNAAELRQMINLSESTLESKNYLKAKDLHEDTLEMALEIGDDSNAIMLLDKLAFFQTVLKKHTGAIEYHEQALGILKDIEDIDGQINILLKIAAIHEKLEDRKESIDFLNQALELAEQNESPQEQRKILSNIGKAYFKSEDYNQALEYHKKAFALGKKLKDSFGVACDLWGISLSFEQLDNLEEAVKTGEAALKVFMVQKKSEVGLVQKKIKSWKNATLAKTS